MYLYFYNAMMLSTLIQAFDGFAFSQCDKLFAITIIERNNIFKLQCKMMKQS